MTSISSDLTAARYRYSGAQRFLHLAMAAAIIGALAIGIYCAYLDRGTPYRQLLMGIHKSLGMTALALVVMRIPVRLVKGEPVWRRPPSRAVRLGAHAAHGVLYLLMLLMPVSGYVMSASQGRTISWFGLFDWPLVVSPDRGLGRMAAMVHGYGGYAFFLVLGLHLAAVAWHRLVKKDEVLSRMV